MDEPSLAEIVFKIFLVFFFVCANGFFVLSEFAFVTVRKSWVETLVKKGNRRARVLLRVITNLDDYIAATQLGITIASLALGWIGEPAVAALLRPLLANLPGHIWPAAATHTVSIGIAFGLITFLHVVIGELAPKTLALERAEKMALAAARPMFIFYHLFYPFVKLLNKAGIRFLQLLRLPPAGEHRAMYAEEIQQMINLSRERGLLEPQAHQLMSNVFDFSGLIVRNVMRPRGEVTVVDVNTPIHEIIQLFAQTGYSRLPVYRDQRDNIIGVLYSKDLLPRLDQLDQIHIESLLRPPLFVPDAISVGEALRQMLQAKKQFSIVVDEYGAFEGILSMEDLLEELVGEIRDEHDVHEESDIIRQTDGAWIVNGLLTVREVNRRLQLNIPESDDYATLAGFLMSITGRLPTIGEKISHKGLLFTIQHVKGRRIDRVRIEVPAGAST